MNTNEVSESAFEFALVPDDAAAEEIATYRSNRAFRERVGDGCADRGLEDLEAR